MNNLDNSGPFLNLNNFQEVESGIVTTSKLEENLLDGSTIVIKGRQKNILVGKDSYIKVNTNLGLSKPDDQITEYEKLETLCKVPYRPDTIMDLSVCKVPQPLFLKMINLFDGAVGSLPHYLSYKPKRGIEKNLLLDEIESQAEAGIGFMTLHLTPTLELIEMAKKLRRVPFTSRGGGMIIADMLINKRNENIFIENLEEICNIFRKYNMVLSIGSAFRPSSVIDGFDSVHLQELKYQSELVKKIRSKSIQVMIECISHATLSQINKYVEYILSICNAPIMPLGPVTTDIAIGEDHIASAIGSSHMALLGGAHILNSVTREEHTGGIPKIQAILEGLRTARISAYSVNISKYNLLLKDEEIYREKSLLNSCSVASKFFDMSITAVDRTNCERCGPFCPYKIING